MAKKKCNKNIWWIVGEAAVLAVAVFTVYYWRVFYSFDGTGAVKLTVLAAAVFSLLYFAVFCTVRFARTLAAKTALLLAVVGACTAVISPPMQVPDEASHYLRAYAISMGRFDFDATRGYPQDVDMLMECFPAAYTNANDGAAIKQYYTLQDPEDVGSTKIPDGEKLLILQRYQQYRSRLAAVEKGMTEQAAKQATEPGVVQVLPYIPQAVGIGVARLCGGDALIALYVGRLFNLAVYVVLAYLAINQLKKWQGVWIAVLFLPISVYMAASLSYDAQLLGLYALAAALLMREKFATRQLWHYLLCVTAMCVAKPWINLLWLFGLLFLPEKVWQPDKKLFKNRWDCIAWGIVVSTVLTLVLAWYGRTFRFHYAGGRMLADVDVLQQIRFVLLNPLRTVAVFWGTLYENGFFLSGFGNFGALDTQIPVVAWASVLLLVVGAVSESDTKPLSAKLNVGLGLFTVIYAISVIGAMYITYTPVGMVRVIGLQLRYFIPAILTGLILAAQGCGLLIQQNTGKQNPVAVTNKNSGHAMLLFGFGCAVYAAVLQLETYFIGPVIWKLSETL